MKIRYTSASPKSGQEEHINNQTAATLIAAGFAVAVPLPLRGTVGWAEARVAESLELSGGKCHPSDTPVPAFIAGVEWSLGNLSISARPCIVRKSGFETSWFESLTWFDGKGKEHDDLRLKECPLSIRKQFVDLLVARDPERFALQQERLVHEQYKAEAENKKGTNLFFRKLGLDV